MHIIITTIIIMIVFLERLSMSNMLNCTEQKQVQNTKHMHIRHPKQHVSKQSCSNIQLSSEGGGEKILQINICSLHGLETNKRDYSLFLLTSLVRQTEV